MPTTESADNDQLFVLTAVLPTPAQFPNRAQQGTTARRRRVHG